MATRQPTDRGRPVTQPKEAAKAPAPDCGRCAHQGRPGAARQERPEEGRPAVQTADCTRHLLALEQTAGQAEAVPARGEASGSVQLSRGCFRGWQSLRLRPLACNTVYGGTLREIVEAENRANLSDERQFTVSRCGGWQLPQR